LKIGAKKINLQKNKLNLMVNVFDKLRLFFITYLIINFGILFASSAHYAYYFNLFNASHRKT